MCRLTWNQTPAGAPAGARRRGRAGNGCCFPSPTDSARRDLTRGIRRLKEREGEGEGEREGERERKREREREGEGEGEGEGERKTERCEQGQREDREREDREI